MNTPVVITGYKFQLDKSSKKFHCPRCEKKRYVRYVNIHGQYLDYQYGRCDREVNCGYFLKPEINIVRNPSVPHYPHNPQSPQVTYIPNGKLNATLTACGMNNFVKYLTTLFGKDIAGSLVNRFYIGTSKTKTTCFWQVDEKGRIRQCKVMLYNPETGRRNKDKGAWFIGKKLMGQDAYLKQCLYGMHQLGASTSKPIAIVESEKTAILATVYLPQYIWMATGGKQGARIMDQIELEGRSIILFPDLGCYQDWLKKAKDLERLGCRATVSRYLERVASDEDKTRGYDIADYLVRQDTNYGIALTEDDYPVMWDMHEAGSGHTRPN